MSRRLCEMRIRPAVAADEPCLRELAAAAKGHWGYEPRRVKAWADALDLSGLGAPGGEFYLAELGDTGVGWLALVAHGEVCELDHLWVSPAHIGKGIGSDLFRFGVGRARELGASSLRLESEPKATGFYEKLGARRAGKAPGSWGRPLPVMQLDLRD
jgi:GNAT superfamily N-acetyltransferase